jgi:hypothetical protein
LDCAVARLIEFKKYIQFFFDYYMKKFGEEVVILPVIYEHMNIEIDLVMGESSGTILGLRYYENAPETDDEDLPEEINLLDNESSHNAESEHLDETENKNEEDEKEEEDDTVWDLTFISEKQVNGEIILSFVFSFEKYFAEAENASETDESDSLKLPKELIDSRSGKEEKDIIIKDPIINIEIFSAKGRLMGARIKKYDPETQSAGEILGYYVLDGELFRRQIFF